MKSKILDQYYTDKKIAKKLYTLLDEKYTLSNFFLVEPSAGDGSFSDLFHEDSVAFDIDPKSPDIIKQDFLELFSNLESYTQKPIFTIGNPPFGKNSSLALKFINRAASFSQYIAFILPKTFRKDTMINKIDPHFHCVYEEEIDKNAFLLDGQVYDVPCVFQIWEKRKTKREKIMLSVKSPFFKFVSKDEADFAIRRVGGLAGKVLLDFENYKDPSHYYIKINDENKKTLMIEIFKNAYDEFQDMAKNTAGNPSLSKGELIAIIEKKLID